MTKKGRNRWIDASIFLLLLLVWSTVPATAAQEPASGAYATEIVEAMGAFIESAEQFSFTFTSVNAEMLENGLPFTLVTDTRIAVRRPDRFWVDVRSDQVHNRFLYDGSRLTLYHLMANVYAEMNAPATIDTTLTRMEDEFDIFVPLADLIASDAGRRILDGVNEITYLGLDEVDVTSCHHIFAQQDDLDFEVWVEDTSVLVPRKLIFHFKNDEGSPTYTALISNWDFSPHLPDAVFTQPAPQGARRIELQGTSQGDSTR